MAANKTHSLSHEFKKGLWQDVAPFRLVLGLCPALAVTNSLVNGLSMGLATLFVLTFATFTVSIIRNIIAAQVRIPAYIVIIATFVTITDLFLTTVFPDISKALGPYIPLIIVNCLILGRCEAFAQKHSVVPTFMDAAGVGVGFAASLTVMGGIREMLGFGSLASLKFLTAVFEPWVVMILPAGAFLVFGALLALVNYVSHKKPGTHA